MACSLQNLNLKIIVVTLLGAFFLVMMSLHFRVVSPAECSGVQPNGSV
jgi:hypothetical protein